MSSNTPKSKRHLSVKRSPAVFEWGKFLMFKFHKFFVQTFLYLVFFFSSNFAKKMVKNCDAKEFLFFGVFEDKK